MTDLTELNKLEKYLWEKHIPYERIDQAQILDQYGIARQLERHQICVPDANYPLSWDVICNWGSYGYEEGLLELSGDLVDYKKDGDTVVGWLTAAEVIGMIEAKEGKAE